MKTLLLGILFLILIGIGGFLYRNAVEHPNEPIACPMDAKQCPDGTAVGRTGSSCTFPACPPPNVSLEAVGIAFAVPAGYQSISTQDPAAIVAYQTSAATFTEIAPSIIVRRFMVGASSTPLQTIQQTAIGGASGVPVPATAFSTARLGTHLFTVVSIERFEAVIDTAYYLARANDVLRFDAIDHGVLDWTSPALDVHSLPAAQALRTMLSTLEGQSE